MAARPPRWSRIRPTLLFALAALPIVLLVFEVISKVAERAVSAALVETTEQHNVGFARALANIHAEAIGGLLSDGATGPAPPLAAFGQPVVRSLPGTLVAKVNLYALSGLTLYSTDAKQIGEGKKGNPGFEGARAGRVVSDLTHRGKFDAFEGERYERDVLASYIPIFAADGASVRGVFEIYSDVTDRVASLRRTGVTVTLGAGLPLAVLYVALVCVVGLGERHSRRRDERERRLLRRTVAAETVSRAKSEFMARMSHELRTPLNAIIGFSECLGEGGLGRDPARVGEYAGHIQQSGQHLLSIINDILDHSAMELRRVTLEPEEVDLRPILDQLTDALRADLAAREIRLVVALPSDLPRVWGDPRRLRQAFTQLLSNASKFSLKGGIVTVSGRLELTRDPTRAGMLVTISDEGRGMSAEQMEQAMQPFRKVDEGLNRRYEGLGLGLSIAASLVRLHGGLLAIDSRLGRGTTVTVRLPRRPPAEAVVAVNAAPIIEITRNAA